MQMLLVDLRVSGRPDGIVTMMTQTGCKGRGDS